MNAPSTGTPGGIGPWGSLSPQHKKIVLAAAAGLPVLILVCYFLFRSKPVPVQAEPEAAVAEAPAGPAAPPAAKPIDVLPPVPAKPPAFSVMPHGAFAQDAFDDLRRQKLIVLSFFDPRRLYVPPALRFKPVPALDLVSKIAATESLEVAWYRNRWVAVVYRKADADKMARFAKDIAAKDPAVRARAAWCARWLRDPRVLEPLLKATKDATPEVARQAVVALRSLGWEAALLANQELAWPVVEAELSKSNSLTRARAIAALAVLDPKEALPRLEAIAKEWHSSTLEPKVAGTALAGLDHPQAFALFERMLRIHGGVNRGKPQVLAGFALPGAVDLLGQALDHPDEQLRAEAAFALGQIRHPDKYPFVQIMFESKTPNVPARAVEGLGQNGGAKEFEFVKQALGSEQTDVAAAGELGRFGPQAWPELERILLGQHTGKNAAGVQAAALLSLGHLGDERAVQMLVKHLRDSTPSLRDSALRGLALVRDERAQQAIVAELDDPESKLASLILLAYCTTGGPHAFPLMLRCIENLPKYGLASALPAVAKCDSVMGAGLLKSELFSDNSYMRSQVRAALELLDGDDAMALLEDLRKAEGAGANQTALQLYYKLGDPKGLDVIRKSIDTLGKPIESAELSAVESIGGAGAVPLIANALMSSNDREVGHAAIALCHVLSDLDPTAQADAVKRIFALKTKPRSTARQIFCDMAYWYGDESLLPKLEAMLAEAGPNEFNHYEIRAIQGIGGKKALELLAKVLNGPSKLSSDLAAYALGHDGSDQARDLLVKRVAVEQDKSRMESIRKQFERFWPNDRIAADALADIDRRLPTLKAEPRGR